MSERRTVNVAQAMTLTGRSKRSIYYLIAAGKIKCAPKQSKANSVQIYADSLTPNLTRKPERCIISSDEARP